MRSLPILAAALVLAGSMLFTSLTQLLPRLLRALHANDIAVVEVDRPNRQRRRRRGKSDPQDAITAARAAQSGDSCGLGKTRTGNVETMRVLRVARLSARKARTQALNQMRSIISTAPDEIRSDLRHLNVYRLLQAEIADIDVMLKALVADTAPELAAVTGVGTDVATALLVAAGDNTERLRSEATADGAMYLAEQSRSDAPRGQPTDVRRSRPGHLNHVMIT